MAQRMESAAPPGGVMISESTARLVENAAVLGDSELVQIKGTDVAVPARRLLAVGDGRTQSQRREPTLVGRTWELSIRPEFWTRPSTATAAWPEWSDRPASARAGPSAR